MSLNDADQARVNLAKALLDAADQEITRLSGNLNQILDKGQGLRFDIDLQDGHVYIRAEVVPQTILAGAGKPPRTITKLEDLTPDGVKAHLKAKGVDVEKFEFKADPAGGVIVKKKAKLADDVYRQMQNEISAVGGSWVPYEQGNESSGLWRIRP